MDVTIFIVSYNVSSFLERCLSSIERETSCEHEIIVVDNNSQDDSVEITRAFHPDIKLLLNRTNRGFSRANNSLYFGLVKGLDMVYYSIVLLKNVFQSEGEVKRSKIDEAKAVLSLSLSSEMRASRP